MEKVPLYDEYRLIERSEAEVNGAWKGAHLLLFFLAFIFGSFCTFCFHMLMYLFDEKCVLFPKLLSLAETRHSVIYDFIPDKSTIDKMPVDFVSTQWMEKSACYLPTYLPLLSGICGLIWTAMFLMCSSGYQTLTGSQRSWRILPPMFVFSFTMGALCIYSSAVTHSGLLQLCNRLGEITGSNSCSYTVNVATLAYERRIRGVYQAVRLTIISAWLHTSCWLISGVLALVRVLLVVDFRLVRVRAELQGDLDKILEHHEKHIRTVSPDVWIKDSGTNTATMPTDLQSSSSIKIHFRNRIFNTDHLYQQKTVDDHLHYYAHSSDNTSTISLVPDEQYKLERLSAYEKVADDAKFIVKIIHDVLDTMEFPDTDSRHSIAISSFSSDIEDSDQSTTSILTRHPGQQMIEFQKGEQTEPFDYKSAEEIATVVNSPQPSSKPTTAVPSTATTVTPSTLSPSISSPVTSLEYESVLNITEEMALSLERKKQKDKRSGKLKSSMKSRGVQTDSAKKKPGTHKVQIKSKTDVLSRDASEETLKPSSEDEQPLSDKDSKDKDAHKPIKEKQD